MVSVQVIDELKSEYSRRKDSIKTQLDEFKKTREDADDRRIFEELAFCILTSAVGPRVGLKSLEAIKDILLDSGEEGIEGRLKGNPQVPRKSILHSPHAGLSQKRIRS